MIREFYNNPGREVGEEMVLVLDRLPGCENPAVNLKPGIPNSKYNFGSQGSGVLIYSKFEKIEAGYGLEN